MYCFQYYVAFNMPLHVANHGYMYIHVHVHVYSVYKRAEYDMQYSTCTVCGCVHVCHKVWELDD